MSLASESHGRCGPAGVSLKPSGALMAAASNAGRESTTSCNVRKTIGSSTITVTPASRAGTASHPAGHGVMPASNWYGRCFAAMINPYFVSGESARRAHEHGVSG